MTDSGARAAQVATVAKSLLLIALGAIGIADIYYRSHAMLFVPDEVYNLDPIVTFYRRLDYTTWSQGGHPFDPVLSSGILATWLNGAVFVAGGTLFTIRLVSAYTQMALVLLATGAFLRTRGVPLLDAAVVAAGMWAALIPVGSHELRIINSGEIWGILYIAAGLLLAQRSANAAAFVWGLATWLVKIIYLPFTGLLLAALLLVEVDERPEGAWLPAFVRTALRLGLLFLLPLFLWMALIWARYDSAVLVGWCYSYLTFVAEHAAQVELEGLPVYEGWQFALGWNNAPLLSYGWEYGRRFVVPLIVAGTAIAAHTGLRVAGVVPATRRETAFFVAVCSALAFEVVWFFAFDPTQWGRHLMPTIYIGLAVALYCVVDVWRAVRGSPRAASAVTLVAYGLIAWLGFRSFDMTRTYAATDGWKISYSKTCRGPHVLGTPCEQKEAVQLISTLAREICDTDRDPFDPSETCKFEHRAEFVARGAALLADPAMTPADTYTAAYVITLLQGYDYYAEEHFLYDLAPLVCGEPSQLLIERLERLLGIGPETIAAACAIERDPD